MTRSFRGGGKSSSASSGLNITRIAASLIGLSALNKNLANLQLAPYSCELLVEEYEECMSRTSTNYDAQHCEKIRKRMASCLESVRRRVGSYEEHKEDLKRKATAAGFACIVDYLRHEDAKDPEKCKIVYELYNEDYIWILNLFGREKNEVPWQERNERVL